MDDVRSGMQTMSFAIRPVVPSEYAALGELTVEAYRGVTAMPQSEAYDDQLRDVARRAEVTCVIAAVEVAAGGGAAREGVGREGAGRETGRETGRVLGGVTYVSGPEDPYSEELRSDEAGIRMLAVAPSAQGRGVGRALTVECLRRARAAGKRRVVLHTGPWMPRAIALYESLGFVRDPSIDFTPVPGIDLLAYVFDFG